MIPKWVVLQSWKKHQVIEERSLLLNCKDLQNSVPNVLLFTTKLLIKREKQKNKRTLHIVLKKIIPQIISLNFCKIGLNPKAGLEGNGLQSHLHVLKHTILKTHMWYVAHLNIVWSAFPIFPQSFTLNHTFYCFPS